MATKVKGYRVIPEEVELDDREVLRIIRERIIEKFDLPYEPFITEDGKLMSMIEMYGGHHSWDEEKIWRDPATEDDKAAVNVLSRLKIRVAP